MRKPYEYLPKRRNDEAKLQEWVCRWLDSKDILYVASLMGVNLGARVGAIRKRMGCRAGDHDLIILRTAGAYSGMTLELKVKGGHITSEQEIFQRRAQANNYYSVIMEPCFELEKAFEIAKQFVEEYLLQGV